MLIAAMVGIDTRTTMDLDATIKGQALNETQITEIINNILLAPVDDNVLFTFREVEQIREEANYSNTIYNTLGIECSDTICYTISVYLDDLDGLYLPFDKIIPYALQNGHGTLIVYPPTGFAYCIDDSLALYQPNYFLKANVSLVNKEGIGK